jgi:glucose/arabinose dehydrogenase
VLTRNLAVPWAIAFLPDGDALVTERDSARLLRVTPHGRVSTVGTVPGVEPYGEGGLLGVAVSPSFGRDRLIYLYFSTADDNRIVRFRYSGGIGPLETVVTGIPRAAIHNGGRLAFGPDGMLWAATGEHGEPGLAQDRDSLGGKILRMTPDGRPAPGNPFGTLVWSYGHRNVQGLAWDGGGRMYATELGQNRFDEINRIRKGHNYGWPVTEGAGGGRGYTDPELTWPTEAASPSGAAIAGGSLWVAALRGERLWQVPLDRTGALGAPAAHFAGEYGRLRAVVRAPDGSLWLTTSNRDGRGSPGPDDDKILVIRPR